MRLLLISTSDTIRQVLEQLAELRDLEVIELHTGPRRLEVLERLQQREAERCELEPYLIEEPMWWYNAPPSWWPFWLPFLDDGSLRMAWEVRKVWRLPRQTLRGRPKGATGAPASNGWIAALRAWRRF